MKRLEAASTLPDQRRSVTYIMLLVVTVGLACAAAAADFVPLRVDTAPKVNAPAGYPVTTGVPFKDGRLTRAGMGDASGCIWDWTDSSFDERRSSRVLRGGSWYNPIANLACANRGTSGTRHRDGGIGFRCARSLPPSRA